MTIQVFVDTIARKLATQKMQCSEDGSCRYKAGDNHCAVGHCLVAAPDSSAWDELNGVRALLKEYSGILPGVDVKSSDAIETFNRIQSVHDDVESWNETGFAAKYQLLNICESRNLDTSRMKKFLFPA